MSRVGVFRLCRSNAGCGADSRNGSFRWARRFGHGWAAGELTHLITHFPAENYKNRTVSLGRAITLVINSLRAVTSLGPPGWTGLLVAPRRAVINHALPCLPS